METAQQTPLVARVRMPEGGQFLVRVEEGLIQDGTVTADTVGKFIVALDYGEDAGFVAGVEPYDERNHGARLPGFRLLRPFTEQDERTAEENGRLAAVMRTMFMNSVKGSPDLRIPYVRLSFGRKRLFMKYVIENAKPNFSAAQDLLKRQYGLDVIVRAMGPRDEIAEFGGLGPCGRVCCCCSWQHRFPQHISPGKHMSCGQSMNGTCGRFKCCLAFERDNQ